MKETCLPPQLWQGVDLKWDRVGRHPFVLIDSLKYLKMQYFLLGRRYELADLKENHFGEGHFLEYFVASRNAPKWTVHRLIQNMSSMFTSTFESKDYVDVDESFDQERDSFASPPNWVDAGNAYWPTSKSRLMTFIGQYRLRDCKETRLHLTFDKVLYLFAADDGTFKIATQSE
jgi:hypothetical protein